MMTHLDDWQLPRRVGSDGGPVRKVWRAGKAPRAPVPNQQEVIVRVTARTRSPQALLRQLDYVTRRAALPGEVRGGRVLHTRAELAELRDLWVMDNAVLGADPNWPTQSVGVVLSMPAGTSLPAVTEAARTWAHQNLPHTDWLLVTHADRAHPHVHVSVRSVQDDGRRVRAAPAEVQRWREDFAQALRAQGIPALATPRREKVEQLLRREPEPVPELAPRYRLVL